MQLTDMPTEGANPIGLGRSRVRVRARRFRAGQVLGLTNRLELLARLYGGTDKRAHGYLPHYEQHLGPRRMERLVLFEIGVGGYTSLTPGGSLAIWRDYLVRSTIVGLDIHEKTVDLGARVSFERANQSSTEDLEAVVGRHGAPDVVIDDGSHVGEDIRAAFLFLWERMPVGGLYVIEDLSTSYYPDYGGNDPPPASSAMGLIGELADSVQALDTTFAKHPDWGTRSAPKHRDVQALHVYPGIAFMIKGRATAQ